MKQVTDLGRDHRDPPRLRDITRTSVIARAAGIVSAAADATRAIVDDRRSRSVSILDKLDLVVERRLEHDKMLGDGADAVLARYAELEKKAARAFDKHHARLDAEEKSLDATEDAIDRLSNAADDHTDAPEGNSRGSGQSSGPQDAATIDVKKTAA